MSMDERKIPQGQQEQADDYSFLQEVIKDEAGSKTQVKRRTLRMIGYGLVFGVVASVTFCVSKPLLEDKFADNPKQVTIPKDEEEGEAQKEQPKQTEEALTAEHYKQVLKSLHKAAAQAADSVVEVTGLTGEEDWMKESDRNKQSVSGAVIADNGQELLILGKILPVKNVKNIQITFTDGERYDAAMKMADYNLGLGIYSVDRRKISDETMCTVTTAKLGNSNLAARDDAVIFLGRPFGCVSGVSYGLITSEEEYRRAADGTYGLISTDISGSEEGSGFIADMNGDIIGIVDQKMGEQPELISGYSISQIKEVIELLSNGISVPYIGIRGMDVMGTMEDRGIPNGVYVEEVEADSPAMQAGIQSGDIIMSVDGTECMDYRTYHNEVMKKQTGDQIVLKGCRQGADKKYVDIEFTITVGSKK